MIRKRCSLIILICILCIVGGIMIAVCLNKGKKNEIIDEIDDSNNLIDEGYLKNQCCLVFPKDSIHKELSNNGKSHYGARVEISKQEWEDIYSRLNSQGWNFSKNVNLSGKSGWEDSLFSEEEQDKDAEEWDLIREVELPAKRWIHEIIYVVRRDEEKVYIFYIVFVMGENAG